MSIMTAILSSARWRRGGCDGGGVSTPSDARRQLRTAWTTSLTAMSMPAAAIAQSDQFRNTFTARGAPHVCDRAFHTATVPLSCTTVAGTFTKLKQRLIEHDPAW